MRRTRPARSSSPIVTNAGAKRSAIGSSQKPRIAGAEFSQRTSTRACASRSRAMPAWKRATLFAPTTATPAAG